MCLHDDPSCINCNDLSQTHIKLGSARGSAGSLDLLMTCLQGEVWSPRGEARLLILALGLKHTSMSVGDIIRNPDGKVYMVSPIIGFKHLNP